MLLMEYYGNLEMIDKSLLKPLKNYIGKSLTPTTKVTHDLLKKDEESGTVRKTWKYITDVILSDDDVFGIIVRSNHRQLMLVYKIFNYNSYAIAWSDVGRETSYYKEQNGSNQVKNVPNLTIVRHDISKTVESFILDHPNARKNWDIIIIGNDKTSIEDKKYNRTKQKENIIPLPHENGYNNYIASQYNNLKDRLVQYSESKLRNIQSIDEMKDMILSNPKSLLYKKIKLLNSIWEFSSVHTDVVDNTEQITIDAKYTLKNGYDTYYKSRKYFSIFDGNCYLVIRYKTQGINGLEIDSMYFKSNSYSNNYVDFEQVMNIAIENMKSADENG